MITIDQQVIIVDRHTVLAPPKTSASLRDIPLRPARRNDSRRPSRPGRADVLCRTSKGTLLRRDYYNRHISGTWCRGQRTRPRRAG